MKLSIIPLSQRDERWKLKKLGTSSVSIGNYGCLLTCHSMMLRYYGHDLLPDALNAVYVEKNVFDQGSLVNFWEAANCFEGITADEYYNCYNDPCDLSKVYKHLDAKKPVIALVDFEPTPGVQTHFIIIHGYNDEVESKDLLCIDPWTGEEVWFQAKWGDPVKYIFGLRLYSGKPKEVINVEDQLSDCQIKVKSLNEALAQAQLENSELRTALENQERDNRDLSGQLLEARSQRDSIAGEKKILEKKVEELVSEAESLKKGMKILEEEKQGLSEALEKAQALKLDDFSTQTLVLTILGRIFKRG